MLFIRRYIDPDQREKGNAKIDKPSRPVDQRRLGNHPAPFAGDRSDRFAGRKASCHDILNHQDLLPGFEAKPPAKSEHPIRPLEEKRLPPQRARHFMTDDDAPHGRRHDDIDRCANLGRQSGSKGSRQPFAPFRISKDSRALEITGAVQSGGEDEMAFKKRLGLTEFRQNLVVCHAWSLACSARR